MGKFFRVALKTRVYDFQRSEGNILLLGWDLEKAVDIYLLLLPPDNNSNGKNFDKYVVGTKMGKLFSQAYPVAHNVAVERNIWGKRWRGFGEQARRQPCRRTQAPSEWTATLYLSFPFFPKFLFKVQYRIDNESSSFFCISYLSVYYLWNFCFVSVLIQLMWDTQCLQHAFLPSLGPTSVTIAPPTKMVTGLSSDWKSQKMIQNGKLTWKNSQGITHKRLTIGTTF